MRPLGGVDHDLDHAAVLEVGERRGLAGRAAGDDAIDAGFDLALDVGAERFFVDLAARNGVMRAVWMPSNMGPLACE